MSAALCAVAIAAPIALAPYPVSAEGLFDFFFGGAQRRPQQQLATPPQANFFADPNASSPQPAAPLPRAASSGPSFCVRSCDGKYFP
jgi:hypothetical protein